MSKRQLFDLRHTVDAEIHTYSCSAALALDAVWPGLWEQEYPKDESLNPYLRFGINNGDGEPLAVWRAFAWAITSGTSRHAIPNYYGDGSAKALGLDPSAVDLVDWEYEVDVSSPDAEFQEADRGFVPGRHVVPSRPEPSEWGDVDSSQGSVTSSAVLGGLESGRESDERGDVRGHDLRARRARSSWQTSHRSEGFDSTDLG